MEGARDFAGATPAYLDSLPSADLSGGEPIMPPGGGLGGEGRPFMLSVADAARLVFNQIGHADLYRRSLGAND